MSNLCVLVLSLYPDGLRLCPDYPVPTDRINFCYFLVFKFCPVKLHLYILVLFSYVLVPIRNLLCYQVNI